MSESDLRDWAYELTHCPAGHPAVWPDAVRSFTACPGCPYNFDDRGHFILYCEPCHRKYYPPGCPQDPPRS
jgi:hypothetical protein